MTAFDFDMGVLGGGAAGLTVASGAARLGAKTLLVEKEPKLGGDCLHFGCVPSKTLIKSANVYHLIRNAAFYGLPAVDVPPVDFKEIRNRIQSVIDIIQRHDSKERFCGLGVRVEFGHPRFTDEHTIRLNGRSYSAKNWTIATGSSASLPPIPGLAQTPHLTNREIFYLDRLPASLIILGAGPIGIEMAQAFNRLGSHVAVIDRAGQILIKEDKDLADRVMHILSVEGVVFHLQSGIEAVREVGLAKEVTIRDNQGQRLALRADSILVAVGRKPNIADLGLEVIGMKTEPGGIVVDKRMRTNQKHIFAAGDVNGGFQFTHAAGYEAGIIISNAVFHLPRKADFTFLPWCTYTDPELASIGMNEQSARRAGIDIQVFSEEFQANDRSLAEGRREGCIKLILDRKEKPLGVQILGLHAGELVGEWVAALNGAVKLARIAAAVHPYPTLGEISKKAAGDIFAPKIFSPKMQKGLKFFFNLKGRACDLPDNLPMEDEKAQ
ncbi:MAG: FAD-dependent oxidoreductase [Desulfobacteraceae bacterium]|nr:MAG: FAD-dependent oxidoreductase [Desulfobacteraceae bacterium]